VTSLCAYAGRGWASVLPVAHPACGHISCRLYRLGNKINSRFPD